MSALPAFTAARFTDLRTALDRVYCADALDLLRALPDASVDAIITDPPYGLAARGAFGIDRSMGGIYQKRGKFRAVFEEWDHDIPLAWMSEAGRVVRPGGAVVVFGGMNAIHLFGAQGYALGWKLLNTVTVVKASPMPNITGRMLTHSTEAFHWFCPAGTGWVFNKSAARNGTRNLTDVWAWPYETPDQRVHPTQKPLALMSRIVALFTEPEAVIVDPFMGSGTTAAAARNLGRHYIGGDLSPEYVAIAQRRLAQPYTISMFPEIIEGEAV